MKKLFLINILFCFYSSGICQNVGIDVADPAYKLDVKGTIALRQAGSNNAGILFDGVNQTAKTFMGMMDNNILGIKSNLTNTWPLQLNLSDGFVGLGNISPTMNLDIKGRPRIKFNGTNSPGVWFDGTSTSQSSFIGNFDNDYVGLYGNGSWNLLMNVNNGNVGIGNTSPTSKLDINGSFRMRSSFPKTGSVMMSSDANGNAEWFDAIAFKATGGYNNEANELNSWNTPAKIYFNQIPEYNLGFAYQANNSQFVAQMDGIYHFEVVLDWSDHNSHSNIILKVQRNNNIIEIADEQQFGSGLIAPVDYFGATLQPSKLSADYKLLAGDIVWVEVDFITPSYADNYNYISASPTKTWFTGHLLTRI